LDNERCRETSAQEAGDSEQGAGMRSLGTLFTVLVTLWNVMTLRLEGEGAGGNGDIVYDEFNGATTVY